jgi:acid phosphatase class B
MKYYLGKAEPLMNHQISTKKKNEKTKKGKNIQKILNPFPLIHLEVVNIVSSFEGRAAALVLLQ